MTPKEKAEELVKKYHKDILNTNYFGHKKAKQCALIAVDEIIKSCKNFLIFPEYEDRCKQFSFDKVDYWQEVKNEIDRL